MFTLRTQRESFVSDRADKIRRTLRSAKGNRDMKHLTCIAIAGLVSGASAQTEVLYTTNGDGATLTMYQGGSGTQTTTHVRGYPITVHDTVWIGDYNGAQPNALEYDLVGNPMGGSVPYDAVLAVDATSDGEFAYELGNAFNSTATVYRLAPNLDSSNREPIFDLAGDNRFVGITYDHANGTLWISAASSIYEYNLAGNLLSSFPHNEGDGHALAYESSTQTLWTARASTLWQYDRSGNLLKTIDTGFSAGNNWGAEFPTPDGGDCPADLDGDDDTDADDFFAYLDAFANGNLAVCDIDNDGDCDADDFFGYLDLFAQGC